MTNYVVQWMTPIEIVTDGIDIADYEDTLSSPFDQKWQKLMKPVHPWSSVWHVGNDCVDYYTFHSTKEGAETFVQEFYQKVGFCMLRIVSAAGRSKRFVVRRNKENPNHELPTEMAH